MNHKKYDSLLKLNKINDHIQLKKVKDNNNFKMREEKRNSFSSTVSPFLNPFELSSYLKLII
jgi:hypothetical protein